MMLCSNNVGMGTFDLHVLISCASEGFLSQKIWIHILCKETLPLHGVILCVSEVLLSE